MNVDKKAVQDEVDKILRDKSWKSSITGGIACLIVLVLLDSFLFDLAIGLIKLLLGLGGIFLLIRGAWLAWPIVSKKVQ